MTLLQPSQGDVTIRRDVLDAIMLHAHTNAPIEACGIVTDTGRHIPMTNAAMSPVFYIFDVDEHLRVFREIHEVGEHIAMVYHSHTASSAVPSRTDIEYARPGVCYVIVSTIDGNARAYTIAQGVVTEHTIVLVP